MPYFACVNTPGCLPDSDEPSPTFKNTQDAWQYLAREADCDGVSPVVARQLQALAHVPYAVGGVLDDTGALAYSVQPL